MELCWDPPEQANWGEWVAAQVKPVLDAEPAPTLMLVGKSIGSCALRCAASRGLPGVWLTPLVARAKVREALTVLSLRRVPTLLVGGTADRTWDRAQVPGGSPGEPGSIEVLELPGADHSLEYDGDPIRSVDLLREVASAVDRFAVGLAGH